MSDWWTYRPADFLMFAPETYWRLHELHNRATWPAALVAPLIAVALALCTFWRPARAPALRAAALGAAGACAFAGWSFVLRLYAPVNWVARDFSVGFAVLALLWLCVAAFGGLHVTGQRRHRAVGLLLIVWAVALHPFLAWALGRPIGQAEVVGLAPDPTVIACLGLSLSLVSTHPLANRLLRAALALALLWCAISATTLATMGSAQAWVIAAAPVLALAALCWPRQRT